MVLLKCVAVGLIQYPAKSIARANTINGDVDEQINLMKKGVKRVELCCAIFINKTKVKTVELKY